MRLGSFVVVAIALAGAALGCGGKGSAPPAEAPPAATPQPSTTEPTGGPAPTPVPAPPTSSAPTAGAPASDPNKVKVEIAKGAVSINGTPVAFPVELAVLEKALGKASGMIEDPLSKDHRYVYWNGLGIHGRQELKEKQVFRDVTFSFRPVYDLSTKDLSPRFAGGITLEGQPVTADTSLSELGQKVRGLQSVTEKWSTIRYEGHPLSVNVTAEGKGVDAVTVLQPLSER